MVAVLFKMLQETNRVTCYRTTDTDMLQTGKKRGKWEKEGTKFCMEIMSKPNITRKSVSRVHLNVLLPKQPREQNVQWKHDIP